MGGCPPRFYRACKTGKLLFHPLFKNHNPFTIDVDKFPVLIDLLLKVLPEFFPCQFSPAVNGLLIVAGYDKGDFGVENRYIVAEFIERRHQIDDTGKKDRENCESRLLNKLRFGLQFLRHFFNPLSVSAILAR